MNTRKNTDRRVQITLLVTAISVLVLSVIPFITYFVKFQGNTSKIQANWGTFGDFIGGILNPFITYANFLAFLYLSYVLYKNEKITSNKEMRFQGKLVRSAEKIKYFDNANESINNVKYILLSNTKDKAEEIITLFKTFFNSISAFKILYKDFVLDEEKLEELQNEYIILIQYFKKVNGNEIDNKLVFKVAGNIKTIAKPILYEIKKSIELELNEDQF